MNENHFTPAAILAKNTMFNLLGMLLPILVGIVSIPFAIKGLGTEGFGILSVIWILLAYLTLLDFGLSRATTKFTAESLKKNRTQNIPSIMWTALAISFGLGCFGAVILFLLTPTLVDSILHIPPERAGHTIQALYILAITLPFLLISISLKGMLGAAQRFDLVNGVHIPVSILNFIFPALSLPFGLGLPMIVLLIAVSRILATFVYFFLCAKLYSIYDTRVHIDFDILKKLLSYGGWITVTGVVSPILVYIDRFFIGSMYSMETLTFYAAPLEALTRLRILPMAIMITLFPEFSVGINQEGRERVRMLFGRSMKTILLMMGLLSLILFGFARDILHLWLGAPFAERSTLIFQIFSISILINFLALVPFTFLQGIGRPDLPAKFHIVELLLYIFVLWYLTKTYGIHGAAAAWCARVTLDCCLLYRWSSKFLPGFRQILQENHIWHVLVVLTSFGVLIISIHHIFTDLFLRIAFLMILLIFFLVGIWHRILDDTEKELVRGFYKNVRMKHSISI